MLFDVLPDDAQRCATGVGDEIRAAPQYLLPVDALEMGTMVTAQQAAGDGLEVVGEDRWGDLRGELDKQVNVIGLAVEFDHPSLPGGDQAGDMRGQVVEHRGREATASVLRDENEVVTKRKSAVVKLMHLDFAHA